MDYEKKYKELVAKIKNAHLYAQTDSTKNVLEGILPELAESEDERILEIIKHCIESRYLHTSTIKGISQKQCFAWLEKQGTSYTKRDVDEAFVEGMACAKNELEKQGELIDKLVKYREWLISKTEQWTERKNDKTNSNAGKHCCIGAANALISARAEYEEIFDYESWFEKQGEKKPIKMWHDVSEVPDEMQELLVEWESPDATWHDIAFYDAEIKAFRHLKQPINNVTRWAYVSDILSQSVTKTSEQGWSDTLERQGEKKPFDYENANIQQKDFAPKVEPFDKYEGLTDFERTLADICIGWIGQELGWKQYIKDGADVLLKIAIKMFNSVQDASFEQKPTDNDMVEALRTEYEKGKADAFAEMQKEWSEDDEKRLQSCINILKAKSLMGKVDTANTMWLKSLKQRMGGKL